MKGMIPKLTSKLYKVIVFNDMRLVKIRQMIIVIIYWETTKYKALCYLLYAFTFNLKHGTPYKVSVTLDD